MKRDVSKWTSTLLTRRRYSQKRPIHCYKNPLCFASVLSFFRIFLSYYKRPTYTHARDQYTYPKQGPSTCERDPSICERDPLCLRALLIFRTSLFKGKDNYTYIQKRHLCSNQKRPVITYKRDKSFHIKRNLYFHTNETCLLTSKETYLYIHTQKRHIFPHEKNLYI